MKKRLKSVYIYGSCRKIKTGPLGYHFFGPLCSYVVSLVCCYGSNYPAARVYNEMCGRLWNILWKQRQMTLK